MELALYILLWLIGVTAPCLKVVVPALSKWLALDVRSGYKRVIRISASSFGVLCSFSLSFFDFMFITYDHRFWEVLSSLLSGYIGFSGGLFFGASAAVAFAPEPFLAKVIGTTKVSVTRIACVCFCAMTGGLWARCLGLQWAEARGVLDQMALLILIPLELEDFFWR